MKRVGIYIPTLNKIEFLALCVKSIYANTDPILFDLIICDNASDDGTKEWCIEYLQRQYTNVRYVRHPENYGFAKCLNVSIQIVNDFDYFLFLNNDTIVTPQWLESMLECAEHRERIGIVGPVSNYVGGSQMIKVNLPPLPSFDFSIVNEVARKVRDKFDKVYTREGFISGFCMLIKKECWEEIGPYPENLLTWDDNYLSLLAQFKGWELYVDRGTFIYHFGSQTMGSDKAAKIIRQNREIFKQAVRQKIREWESMKKAEKVLSKHLIGGK